jgi:hypothetical protein
VSNVVTLNGARLSQPAVAGSYFSLSRAWAPGDTLEVLFTPQLTFENVNDPRPALSGVGSVMWGSTLLAVVNTTTDMLPLNATTPAALAAAIRRSPPPNNGSEYTDLVFTAATQVSGYNTLLSLRIPALSRRSSVQGCGTATLLPLADIVFEQYAAVVHTAAYNGTVVSYNGSSFSTVPGSAPGNFDVSGGASVQPLGGAGVLVIRSGDPHSRTVAAYAAHVDAAGGGGGGVVTGVSFSYAYASGFTGAGSPANLSLVALAVDPCADGPGPELAVLYSSPPLSGFPYADCNVYSPMEPEGFLAAGDDLWDGTATVEEAEARCTNLTTCLGFTFAGPLNPPGPVNVYLKSAVNFVPAPGWQTFVSSRVGEGAELSRAQLQKASKNHAHSGPHHSHHDHTGSHRIYSHSHGHRDDGIGDAVGSEHWLSRQHRRQLKSDVAASCFSPPIDVSLSGLSLKPGTHGVQFALQFNNNDQNVRLLLPAPLSIAWAQDAGAASAY